MRRRDPHDDPAPARSRPRGAVPVPTLGALLRQPYWTWLAVAAVTASPSRLCRSPFVGAPTHRPIRCADMRGARCVVDAERRCSPRVGAVMMSAGSRFRRPRRDYGTSQRVISAVLAARPILPPCQSGLRNLE